MRSGKPLPPFRRKPRRTLSGVRIGVLALLFAAVAAFALYRLRPLPLPWHPVGSERIVTPVFDIADPGTREVMHQLAGHSAMGRQEESLLASCRADAPAGAEIYELARVYPEVHVGSWNRFRLVLGVDGELSYEQSRGGALETSRRVLDAAQAEGIRKRLLDAGYAQMRPSGPDSSVGLRPGDPSLISVQSCVLGRYYGVVRGGRQGPEARALQDLAADLEALAGSDADPGDRDG